MYLNIEKRDNNPAKNIKKHEKSENRDFPSLYWPIMHDKKSGNFMKNQGFRGGRSRPSYSAECAEKKTLRQSAMIQSAVCIR